MDRVFKSGASATPPAPPASPSVGYPVGGDPGTGTPATKPGPYWYHMITESLRRLLVASGLTPDHTNLDQVTLAVQELIRQAANDYKPSVRAATTANITALNGGAPNTLDGVTLVAGDRILVKDQTTASQNGLYVVTTLGTGANGTWRRAADADTGAELNSGAEVSVEEGTQADSRWMLTTDGSIIIGTTSLNFTRQGVPSASKMPTVGATVATNALTVTIGPETLDFRSTTLTSGAPVSRSAAATGSLTVPSGATLGTVSGQPARLVWGWVDNAGALEPFICNLAGGLNLDEATLVNTTAMSAAATAANVIYTAVARTGVAFKVRAFCEISEAAAGTWATAPTLVQPVGGQALAALSSLGYGQTWQSPARSVGTAYYNTTGRPILVVVSVTVHGSNTQTTGTPVVGGVSLPPVGFYGGSGIVMPQLPISFVVPPGQSYQFNLSNGSVQGWTELR